MQKEPTSIDDLLDLIWHYAGRVHHDKAHHTIDQALALVEEKGLGAWEELKPLLAEAEQWTPQPAPARTASQAESHWDQAKQRRERARTRSSEAEQYVPKVRDNGAVEQGSGAEVDFEFEG